VRSQHKVMGQKKRLNASDNKGSKRMIERGLRIRGVYLRWNDSLTTEEKYYIKNEIWGGGVKAKL